MPHKVIGIRGNLPRPRPVVTIEIGRIDINCPLQQFSLDILITPYQPLKGLNPTDKISTCLFFEIDNETSEETSFNIFQSQRISLYRLQDHMIQFLCKIGFFINLTIKNFNGERVETAFVCS